MTAKEDFEKRIRGSSWTNQDGGNSHLTNSAVSGLSMYAENTYGKQNATLAGFNKALIEEKAALRVELEQEAHNGDSLRKQLDHVMELLGKCVKCGLHLIDQRAEKSSEIERLQNLLEAAVEAGEKLLKRLEDKTAECEYISYQIEAIRQLTDLPADACAEDVADEMEKRLKDSGKPSEIVELRRKVNRGREIIRDAFCEVMAV